MTIADLIAYFEKAADVCEAYARTNPPKDRMAQDYERRAQWHRDAAKLLLDLDQPSRHDAGSLTSTSKEKANE